METVFYKKYLIKDGLVEYKDDNERLLIEKETLDKSIDTLKDKPVIITHEGKKEVGKVVDVYFDFKSGNYIVGFNIWDKQASELLDNGYSISSTFEVIDSEEAKEPYHNIDYDYKVKDLEFLNIAIVKNPRYNEAKYYVNSIDNEIFENGGKGSGNWGHKGRKGLVGGSSSYSGGNYSYEEIKNIIEKKKQRGLTTGSKLLAVIKDKVKNKLNTNTQLQERLKEFKNNKDIENFKNQRQEKVSGKMIKKYYGDPNVSNYKKGDNKRSLKMEGIEQERARNPNYKPEFKTLVTTNRGAKLIEKDGKIAWVRNGFIREDGSLTKGGLEALKNGKSKEEYEKTQNIIQKSKEVATKQYKEKYNYDIEKDNSIKTFVDMKKKALIKYGNNENIKNILDREFTENDLPQSLRNYVKNSNGRIEANYWEGGDKKRIYFNVFSSNGERVNFTDGKQFIDVDNLGKKTSKADIEKQEQKIR